MLENTKLNEVLNHHTNTICDSVDLREQVDVDLFDYEY